MFAEILNKLHIRTIIKSQFGDFYHVIADYYRGVRLWNDWLSAIWCNGSRRNRGFPLIVKGVRQVGKTWILNEFGKQDYESIAYFNFDEQEESAEIFATTKDVNRILQKSDENVSSRSLTLYAQKYEQDTKIRLRFSLKNLRMDGNLLNIPLFMIDHMEKLIGLG